MAFISPPTDENAHAEMWQMLGHDIPSTVTEVIESVLKGSIYRGAQKHQPSVDKQQPSVDFSTLPPPPRPKKPKRYEDRASEWEKKITDYFNNKKLYKIFEFLMCHLLVTQPDDPKWILTQILDRCLMFRAGVCRAPHVYDEKHLEGIFRACDPGKTGFMNRDQFEEIYKTLKFDLAPVDLPLNREGMLSKEDFIRITKDVQDTMVMLMVAEDDQRILAEERKKMEEEQVKNATEEDIRRSWYLETSKRLKREWKLFRLGRVVEVEGPEVWGPHSRPPIDLGVLMRPYTRGLILTPPLHKTFHHGPPFDPTLA